jgi:hypothetical protein
MEETFKLLTCFQINADICFSDIYKKFPNNLHRMPRPVKFNLVVAPTTARVTLLSRFTVPPDNRSRIALTPENLSTSRTTKDDY